MSLMPAGWGGEGYVVVSDKEGIKVRLSDKQRSHKGADGKEYRDYIVFYPDALETILANAGFSDVRVAMKAMHKEKFSWMCGIISVFLTAEN